MWIPHPGIFRLWAYLNAQVESKSVAGRLNIGYGDETGWEKGVWIFIVSSTRAMAYPGRIELILTAESETAFPPSSELSNLFKNKTKKNFWLSFEKWKPNKTKQSKGKLPTALRWSSDRWGDNHHWKCNHKPHHKCPKVGCQLSSVKLGIRLGPTPKI